VAATLSFTGTFGKGALHYLSFTGGLSFVGSFAKQAQKNFTAALSFTGNINKGIAKTFTGSLTLTGTFVKNVLKNFVASVGLTGTFGKFVQKNFTAALSFTGLLATLYAAKAFIRGHTVQITQIDKTDMISLSNDDRYPIGQQKEVVDLDQQD
jgi:hypothetical protein